MLSKLLRSLFPKGQLFRFFNGKIFRLFTDALAVETARIKIFYEKVRNSGVPGIIPEEALSDWETFLALLPNSLLTAVQRQERILGKEAATGGQGLEYLQDVLQAAGFPVYAFENVPVTIDPRTVSGTLIFGPPTYTADKRYVACLGNFQLGEWQLNEYSGTVIEQGALTIPPETTYDIFIWFLCGSGGVGNFVNIPTIRKDDFIKLVDQIKPAHTWVIAQINWT